MIGRYYYTALALASLTYQHGFPVFKLPGGGLVSPDLHH